MRVKKIARLQKIIIGLIIVFSIPSIIISIFPDTFKIEYNKAKDIYSIVFTSIGLIIAVLGLDKFSESIQVNRDDKVTGYVKNDFANYVESENENLDSLIEVVKKILENNKKMSTIEILEQLAERDERCFKSSYNYINQKTAEYYNYDLSQVKNINQIKNTGRTGFHANRNRLFGKLLAQLDDMDIITRVSESSTVEWKLDNKRNGSKRIREA